MDRQLYVIEKRAIDGALDLTAPQPETYFGLKAITGLTENHIAHAVWNLYPDTVLDGRYISHWPSFVHPRFVARRKTW